jgi:hypothetical protein
VREPEPKKLKNLAPAAVTVSVREENKREKNGSSEQYDE